MYLKELRLQGFKSFADFTRLDLQRGVTAIVGPNGCGKSNIADAIRWVLGEQSPKSLRAGAMQDVIFQGTSSRKAVNLCQVSLVFADCEERLGAAYNEVEITRKVVREGGSEYLLNGKSCRLKDIQRLFQDTGIGQVSYSFMLQGQIDQVLSSNPSERRAIFEEAAGISRYKSQRREALAKLEQVDTNLARVTDVMEEVARQTGSLKRQAAKALRFQRIQHRLTHLDLAHQAWQYAGLHQACEQQRRKVAFLEAEIQRMEAALGDAEVSLNQRRAQVNDLRTSMEQTQRDVYALRSEKDNADNRIEMAQLRADDLRARTAKLQQELQSLSDEETAIAAKIAGETLAKEQQMDLFGSSDEDFQRRSEELTAIQSAVGEAETRLSRNKQAALMKEGSMSRLRSNVTTLELDLKTFQVRHANLAEELHRMAEEEQLLQKDCEQYEHARLLRSEERAVKEDSLRELKAGLADATAQFREVQVAIQNGERDAAGLKSRIQVLSDLQAKFEGFSEGAKAVLQGKLETVVDSSTLSLLLKQLKVAEGYAPMIEPLLGVATEAIVLQDPAVLPLLARQLRERRIGKAGFLVADATDSAATSGFCPAGLQPALAVVHSELPHISAFLHRHLRDCYIADSLDALLQAMENHPDWSFARVVTRDDEWIDSSGIFLVGASSKERINSSFLARQTQIKQLETQLADFAVQRERLRIDAGHAQNRITVLEKRIDEQNALLTELGNELATLAAQRDGAERNLRNLRSNAAAKSTDLHKLEESKGHSEQRMEAARKELLATDTELTALKDSISELETMLEQLRGQRESQREAFNEVRFEIAQKRQRLELLDRGLEELRRKSRENEHGRIQRLAEIDQIGKQLDALGSDAQRHKSLSEDLATRLHGLTRTMDRDRDALKSAERQLAVVEEGLAPQRENLAKLQGEHNRTSVSLAREESRLQFLTEECQRSYEVHPQSVNWPLQLWLAGDALPERLRFDIEESAADELESIPERPDPSAEQLQQLQDCADWPCIAAEVDSLRSRIQSMGPVNLVAIGEYKELKERHAFLASQSEDLWKSKEQLLAAIDEINQTSQQLFSDTFDAIRSNFHYTFDALFGGGKADLQLVDSGDVLESGIDITAQPPGTRLKTLGLLSGGQKTMTAVALLFAIYMVKPSPFCVLDEIDAPLDDANIGRFTDMLERFLEFSQFLIITHNKRTIRVADTIFGATMPEKGVTTMISMRFADAVKHAS